VNNDIAAVDKALEELRRESGITDLEMPTTGRYFQNTITIRLNDLELQKNELDLAVGQIKPDIENLTRLAQGPITEQVARDRPTANS